MEHASLIFLDMTKGWLLGKPLQEEPLTEEEWLHIYKLACQHKLDLGIFESCYRSEGFAGMPSGLREYWQKSAQINGAQEVQKVYRFLNVYRELVTRGLKPLVVKGILCRMLYAKPYTRPSADEDMYVQRDQFEHCCEILMELGFQRVSGEEDRVAAMQDTCSCLHLEIHRDLFDSGKLTDRFQGWIKGCFERCEVYRFEGVPVYGMDPQTHFLYLLAHLMKHFVGPGIGIRQLCDISLWLNRYGDRIEWLKVQRKLREAGCELFCLNILELCVRYFGLYRKKIQWPAKVWDQTDPEDLLEDLLDAGIYGKSSQSRLHSSTMTLAAVQDGRKKLSVRSAVFPSAEKLKGRYGFLGKYPFLLPAAWMHRMAGYAVELGRKNKDDNSPAESVAIANKRIHLLEKYGMIS